MNPLLNLFQDCLIQWRLSPNPDSRVFKVYTDLHTHFYSQTSQILKVASERSVSNLDSSIRYFSIPNHTSVKPLYLKFTTCLVLFYQLHMVTMPIITASDGDPFVVVYFSAFSNQRSALQYVLERIYHVSASGPLLFMNSKDGQYSIKFINIVNPFSSASSCQNEMEGFKSFKQLEACYLSSCLHNMMGFQLRIMTAIPIICRPPFPGSSVPCTFYTFAKVLNLSLYNTGIPNVLRNDITGKSSLNEDFVVQSSIIRSKIPTYRYEIPASGVDLGEHAFVMVLPRNDHRNHLNAMMQPFDSTVWILISCAMIVMPLALTVIAKVKQLEHLKKNVSLWDWTYLSFASLAGQCQDSVRKQFRSHQSFSLWLLWNFFGIIISNSYDGKLYSFMASDHIPDMPDSLLALAEKKYPLVTVGALLHGFTSNGSAILESKVLSLLRPKYNIHAIPKYYQELANRTRFPLIFGKNLSTILYEIASSSQQGQKSQGFAFLDEAQTVDMFYPSFELSQTLQTHKRTTIPNFASLQGWIFRKFFLVKRLHFIVCQMEASGLTLYWDRNGIKKIQISSVQSILSSKTFSAIGYVNNLKFVKTCIKPSPVSMRTIGNVIVVCIFFLLANFIVLFGENVHFMFIHDATHKICTYLRRACK